MKIYLAGNPGSGNGKVVTKRERVIQYFVQKRLLSYYDYLHDKAVLSFKLIKQSKK